MPATSFLRRNLVQPLWAFKDRSNHLKYHKSFEKLQFESREELEHIQFSQLQTMLLHAYTNTSYYRGLFDSIKFDPSQFDDIAQITQIPLLTKTLIQSKSDNLIAKGYKKDLLIPFKTGGSTGKSLTVYSNRERLERGVAVADMCFKWTGWNIAEPIARVWGNPPLPKTMKERLRNILIQPIVWLDTMNLNELSMLEFVKKWEKTSPSLLHGHAHSLYIFAKFLYDKNITHLRPKGIISTSMMLLSHERTLLEKVFDVKVIDLYGCEEVGLIACECPQHEGMHLNYFNNFIEFIKDDGSPAKPGEEGSIVVTSLTNHAMPIIRYRIEDTGVPSVHRCSCGRNMPLMEKITGRVADFLVKKDGSLVAGISLIERTLTKIPGLSQMQIIQKDISNFHLNVVRDDHYCDSSHQELFSALKDVFGEEIKLHIDFVKNIKQEPSGKYRFSICQVKY